MMSTVFNLSCCDQIRPDGHSGGGAEIGGWSIAELSQLHSDLNLVRRDVDQRISLLDQEAPKFSPSHAQAAAAAKSGRGRGGGSQRKKRKTEEADYADGDAATSPRAGSGSGTSDRSVGSGRGRGGRGRAGGKKRKTKRDAGDEDGNDEDEEEEPPAPEDELETMDSTAFWAMIDQQYCDPSEEDIEMLKTIRTTGEMQFLAVTVAR